MSEELVDALFLVDDPRRANSWQSFRVSVASLAAARDITVIFQPVFCDH